MKPVSPAVTGRRKRSDTAARRRSVASRTLAAVAGGYAVATLVNIAAPLVLAKAGLDLPQSLLATMMVSFLLWAAIVMAVFHARSAQRAWAWLACAAFPLAATAWMLLPRSPP